MALVQATESATIKAAILAAMGSTSDGDAKVQQLADALVTALLTILKTHMVVTAPNGPCTVT